MAKKRNCTQKLALLQGNLYLYRTCNYCEHWYWSACKLMLFTVTHVYTGSQTCTCLCQCEHCLRALNGRVVWWRVVWWSLYLGWTLSRGEISSVTNQMTAAWPTQKLKVSRSLSTDLSVGHCRMLWCYVANIRPVMLCQEMTWYIHHSHTRAVSALCCKCSYIVTSLLCATCDVMSMKWLSLCNVNV